MAGEGVDLAKSVYRGGTSNIWNKTNLHLHPNLSSEGFRRAAFSLARAHPTSGKSFPAMLPLW